MRVVVSIGGGRTRLEERPAPIPAEGELLLGLRVCGLCGTDLFKLQTDTAPPGAVLGHEIVGNVVEAGRGAAARGFRPGDRVVVPHHVACGTCVLCRSGSDTMCSTFRQNLLEPGGFSELVLVRRRAVDLAARKVPDHVTDESAVFMEPAACVLRGVRRSGLRDLAERGHDRPPLAVVIGAGGMGLLHVLVLKSVLPGADVFVVEPSADRRVLAVELGAEAAWAPGAARDEFPRACDAVGADAIFDTVGGAAVLEDALALGRPGSSIVLFAHARDGEASGFDLNRFFKDERRLVGTYSGGLADQEEIFSLIVERTLDPSPLATDRLPLSAFDEAVSRMRERRALKVLLTPDT